MTGHLMRLRSLVLPAFAGAALVLGYVSPAGAVPAFARKYRTSCQTCHTIFPKLNPFGQAFRLGGYRMPGETPADVKQEPLSLGAEAYEKVWPEMVYPSDLPGSVPLALNVKMASIYSSSHDETGRTIVRNDFQFPQEANLFAAGTLGRTFSFFAELTYAEKPDGGTDTEIEHARLDIISPFGPDHMFNFKIGKFAPDLDDGFQEMWLMTDNGVDTIFGYDPIGFNGGVGVSEEPIGISLPARVEGFEMFGIASHRLLYTAGAANGIGSVTGTTVDGNSHKDWWARVDYKFGGMGLDGDMGAGAPPGKNWQEKSLRIGGLAYFGNGTDINVPVVDDAGTSFNMQDRRYDRLGLYASWYFASLNIFGVALHGKDSLRLLDPATDATVSEQDHTYDVWFAQADYVFVPPFQGSLRYEDLRPADGSVHRTRSANANFSFLIRANIKAMIEYRRDLHDSENYQTAAVLRFAY